MAANEDDPKAREAMYALGMKHATLEAAGDLEGTMATLVDEPVYEFWPIGRRMVGQEQVRRWYNMCDGQRRPGQHPVVGGARPTTTTSPHTDTIHQH